MAISIVPGSGVIAAIRPPQAAAPANVGGQATFKTNVGMHCEGRVRFNGQAADPRAGWQVGWVQAQWVETNWAYYRGQTDHDGSLFLQRGRAPARPQQACRDTSGPVATIFTDPTDPREFKTLPAGAFPVDVAVESNDSPGEAYALIENNSLTGAPNFLREIQLEFHFCTALTVRDPAGNFQHQAHFYWNMRWRYDFQPTAFPAPADGQWTITAVAEGNGTAASRAFGGPPTDNRFTGVLVTPQVSSCVDLAGASAQAVAVVGSANRREFRRWESPDVRK